mmetsp:Transcript_27920/g.50848  ORF Transcript_27920/g.50848 Transcript_27920/m.50848 type:complete len:154 (+) Transcript_27920:88-549(+)
MQAISATKRAQTDRLFTKGANETFRWNACCPGLDKMQIDHVSRVADQTFDRYDHDNSGRLDQQQVDCALRDVLVQCRVPVPPNLNQIRSEIGGNSFGGLNKLEWLELAAGVVLIALTIAAGIAEVSGPQQRRCAHQLSSCRRTQFSNERLSHY